MQLDPELEALCDFKLILVPKDTLAQEQQPAREHASAPAASDAREQQPQGPVSSVSEQAPQPQQSGELQQAGSSENAETLRPQPGTDGVAAQQLSTKEQAAGDGAEGSKRKLDNTSEAAGARSEEVSLSSKRPRTECDHAKAALLPGVAVVPAIRGVLALHSIHLRHALAYSKQTSMVLPCEDVEAGKQVVMMMMAPPATQEALLPSLAANLSVSTIIRCVHFAIYLYAQVPTELAIDSLCSCTPEQRLTAANVNAMLALPGALQVQYPELFDKVKGLCKRWLKHTFGDAARLLGSEQLKAELCSLEIPAIQLFKKCMGTKLRREEVVHALVLWCSHPSHSASLGHEVFMLFSIQDTGTMLSLPPESGAREVCTKWLLHFYGDVHEVVVQEEEEGESLRSSFYELLFDAVCLWAEQDGLEVRHSENEVAVLLELYADAVELSEAQRQQLGSLLHVSSMSYSFRHFMLPKLSLMSAFSDILPYFNAALDVGGTEGLDACAVEFPPAWVGSRQVPFRTFPFSFECSFSKEKLASMLAGAAVQDCFAESDTFFFGGFYWNVMVGFSSNVEGSSFSVYLVSTSSGPVPAPSVAAKALYSLYLKKADGNYEDVDVGSGMWFKGGKGWGRDIVHSVSSVERLNDYLVDGELWVVCNLEDVV